MRYGWIIVFLVSGLVAFGQNSSKVKQLENQRKKALEEIEMTNQLLNETKKTARSSLNRLNLISNQILSRKKVISILNQEIGGIDTQINKMRREVNRLEQELKVKQKNYGKSAKGMYKRRKSQDKLLFILSADNFAQSLRRMRYLREFADWQKRQAAEIVVKQREIEEKRSALEKTRKDKQVLLGSRENENQKLQTEESSQKTEVQQLTKKQRDLQAQLKKKKQQADALNQQIEKQIAIEIARAEEEARIARQKAERERAEKARLAREAREIRKKQAAASGKKIVEENEEPDPEP
ncbi:MAG: peptidase M24, partial [Porphyromonadaceae bacterium]|nr:peptidase M24 [Porphyromonadaceae bacterium]